MSEEVESKLLNNNVEGGPLLSGDSGDSGSKIRIVASSLKIESSLEDKRSRAVFRQVSSERYFKILAHDWKHNIMYLCWTSSIESQWKAHAC